MAGRSLIALVAAGAAFGVPSWATVHAQPAGGVAPAKVDVTEQILAPPPMYKAADVTIVEHLGATLPLDAKFRTHEGMPTTLGDALRSRDVPTILTFNYADCPLLCSMQLNGLTAAMPGVANEAASPAAGLALRVGEQYRIITISLEPYESLDKLAKMRARYIERLPETQRDSARKGWTFLTAATPGDAAAIRRVADAVGFKYTYIAERAEWAHPAAFIFLTTAGVITRYVYGFEIEPTVLRESIVKAGLAEPSTAVGFLHTCYFYDPDASNHSRAGVMAMRIGAAGFVVLLVAGFGLLMILRRSRSPSGEVS